MANTNTNTNSSVLSTDIYDIAQFIDDIRSDHISDLNATSAMVGIFGYLTEIHSQSLQNTLIAISETSNEAIATRAKFSKNILAHAMNLGITDILAKPATMTMMIYLPIEYLEDNFIDIDYLTGRAKFILSKECPFNIGEYEFHLDYDIIITRIKNSNGNYIYTAMYDLFNTGTTNIKQKNPISDIINPYITTVVRTTIDLEEYIGLSVRMHQVSLNTIEKEILTDNAIENKSITFDFQDQLAAFDIDIIESNGNIKHLTPIYNGLLDYTVEDGEWCYYEYLNENTIRILFSRDSYIPKLNSTVRVNIQISDGFSGNFTYTENFRTSLQSETYDNYNGMYALIYPLMNGISNGGKDKKSISEIKKIIPREASSRGSIINTTDLNNFFNSINDDFSHIYFYKKKDNPFDRLYNAYLILRKNDTVYPTNTLDLTIEQENFLGFSGNNNLAIVPGTKFYYYDHGTDTENDYSTIIPPEYVTGLDSEEYPNPMVLNNDNELVRVFEYINPWLITIDDDFIASYLLTVMNENKTFKFQSINTESNIQFIATNMNWYRKYLYTDDNGDSKTYDHRYYMDMDIMLNSNKVDHNLVAIEKDANGVDQIKECRIKVLMVLYSDNTNNHPYRYVEAELINYEASPEEIFSFRFVVETDDMMDLNNRINIKNIYNVKPEALQLINDLDSSHGYMNKNTYAEVYILADFGIRVGDKIPETGEEATEETARQILYGDDGVGNRSALELIIPTKNDIIENFLKGEIYYTDPETGTQTSIITIMRSSQEYMQHVYDYTGSNTNTKATILRYLRNNMDSEFVQNVLLQNEELINIINSYHYVDVEDYTLCNVLSIDGGINFYHDYSNLMNSVVNITKIQETDNDGNLLYKEIKRTDYLGNEYSEYLPIYVMNKDSEGNNLNTYKYHYTISRIPLIKNNFLASETSVQDFISDLEERRKYIQECMLILEDTFGIDFKFVNTYGPSKRFYYMLPNAKSYKVKSLVKRLYIYEDITATKAVGHINLGDEITIIKTNGLWGYVEFPYTGWVRLADTERSINYIDNVAVTLRFALEAESSADKYITTNIVADIKNYIETINEINEIHIPNIITLITNNYREQLKYFEFLGVNNYNAELQHLYLDEKIDPDVCPEFINVESSDGITKTPLISITVY